MDRKEFERLALEHLEQVYRMAYQLTRSREQAEELVQEVYLRAFKPGAIERFESRARSTSAPGVPAASENTGADQVVALTDSSAANIRSDSIRAWLFTIVHNTFYTMLKRRRQGQLAAPAADNHVPVPTTPSSAASLLVAEDETLPSEPPPAWDLSTLDWEQVDSRLKAAIDALKPEFRQVLLLWGVQGMKYRQIAATLDVPIGTVMSRLYRARKILSDALGGSPELLSRFGVRGSSQTQTEVERT